MSETVNIRIAKMHNPDCRIDLLRDGLQGALVGHTLPATKTLLGNFKIRVAKAIDALSRIDPVNAECWRRFHNQAYAIHPKYIVLNKKDIEIVSVSKSLTARKEGKMVYFKIENTENPRLASRPGVLIAKRREDALHSIDKIYNKGHNCREIRRSEAVEIVGESCVVSAERDTSGVVITMSHRSPN